ncbi:unnamed protein product [Schistocephalus solidus]|uniref:Homeobox domain-containing protein n=1 Tax=Schistocephalus solidus TaxID=70667 RepID=A0A183SQP5_SCHSO|nr:unnamed protein product [Schistocephalus solidus]
MADRGMENDTTCVVRPKPEESPHKVYPHTSLLSYHNYTDTSASFFDSAFEDSDGRSAVDNETEAATSKLLADSAEGGFFSDYSQQNVPPPPPDHVDLQPKPISPSIRIPNPSALSRAVRQPSTQLPLNEMQVTVGDYYSNFTEMSGGGCGAGAGGSGTDETPQAFLSMRGYPTPSFPQQQQPLGEVNSDFRLSAASSSFAITAPPSTAPSLMLMHPTTTFSESLPIDNCLTMTSTPIQPSRSPKLRRSARPLNNLAVQVMESWYTAHQDYPYPSQNDKQVSSWFANRRSRRQNTRPKQKIRKVRESIRAACLDIEQASNGLVKAEDISVRLLALIDEFYHSS